ncbi:MAG: hypothetical protein R2827_15885 [Bdellovibrionales bacterium]
MREPIVEIRKQLLQMCDCSFTVASGAAFATEFAHRHPQLVDGIIAMSMPLPNRTTLEFNLTNGKRAVKTTTAPSTGIGFWVRRSNPGVSMGQCQSKKFESVDVLFLTGAQDKEMIEEERRHGELAQVIPRTTYLELENAGHEVTKTDFSTNREKEMVQKMSPVYWIISKWVKYFSRRRFHSVLIQLVSSV